MPRYATLYVSKIQGHPKAMCANRPTTLAGTCRRRNLSQEQRVDMCGSAGVDYITAPRGDPRERVTRRGGGKRRKGAEGVRGK